MSVKVKLGNPKPVYIAPVNKASEAWGVYALPRLWQEPNGDFVVRINGEADSLNIATLQRTTNIYFKSTDNGKSWSQVPDGENIYDISYITGTEPPFIKLKNGGFAALKRKKNLLPVTGVSHIKEFPQRNESGYIHVYRYGDIPEQCKGIYFAQYNIDSTQPKLTEIDYQFAEREVIINAAAENDEGKYVPVLEYIDPIIFSCPYMTALTQLDEHTFGAVAYGQASEIYNHYAGETYFVVSEDDGKTWHKRSTIGKYDKSSVPDGYMEENSLAIAPNGNILCVMRTEMCIDTEANNTVCNTMYSISKDKGYTWSLPKPIADASVTPHIVTLENGIIVLSYGRPGVHIKYSCDNGETFSEPYTLIGKTLEQEKNTGRHNLEYKYFDADSYCNAFMYPVSTDSVLILYTDLKYNPGDGQNHKASIVRIITFEKE